jgi:CRP-like cAMP-binding protein
VSERELYERFGKVFPAGTVLFRQGEMGNEMFVIQSGEVEISRTMRGREAALAVLPAGEFFGEMALINNRPRSATATVKREARLLVIDGMTFEAMLRGRTEIAVRIIRTLARRLEQADQQIELLLVEDQIHRVVKCLRQLAESQPARDASGGVLIRIGLPALAARVALAQEQVEEILGKLAAAWLVVPAAQAGLGGGGYVVPEVGRLGEFLEFLELKERFDRGV